MATSIRWPADVLAGMKQLAGEHGRSLHSEVIQACKAWIQAERNKAMLGHQETDTIYSRGKLYPWIVTRDPRTRTGEQFEVLADSAANACQYITATKWISRLSLTAEPAEVAQEQK